MGLEGKSLGDKELVAYAQAGDRDAFQALVLRHQSKILNLCYRLLGNPDEAKEAAADVFADAFGSLSKFRRESKFGTWLYRIAMNLCFTRLRKITESRARFIPNDPTGEEGAAPTLQIPSQAANPLEMLAQGETKHQIQIVLSKLSKDHAQILILHDIENLSYVEISEVIDCPPGTVMSRLARAREAFRKKWNQFSL